MRGRFYYLDSTKLVNWQFWKIINSWSCKNYFLMFDYTANVLLHHFWCKEVVTILVNSYTKHRSIVTFAIRLWQGLKHFVQLNRMFQNSYCNITSERYRDVVEYFKVYHQYYLYLATSLQFNWQKLAECWQFKIINWRAKQWSIYNIINCC